MQDVSPKMVDAFSDSLKSHIANVQTACKVLGVSEEQSSIHDESKWGPSEFVHYVRQFQGPVHDPDDFALAWLHHLHSNPHHWQYWIFPDDYTPRGSRVEKGMIEMPRHYCLEMIADWLAASRTYIGSWDMSDWLRKNLRKVRLHSRSHSFVLDTLSDLGYRDVLLKLGFSPREPANSNVQPAAFGVGVLTP